jgi:hypothetical protein
MKRIIFIGSAVALFCMAGVNFALWANSQTAGYQEKIKQAERAALLNANPAPEPSPAIAVSPQPNTVNAAIEALPPKLQGYWAQLHERGFSNEQIQRLCSEGSALGTQINTLSEQGVVAAHNRDIIQVREILSTLRPLVDRFNALTQQLGIPAWIEDAARSSRGWHEAAAAAGLE